MLVSLKFLTLKLGLKGISALRHSNSRVSLMLPNFNVKNFN